MTMREYSHEDFVLCPHCDARQCVGYEHELFEEYATLEPGDECVEIDCGTCDRPFLAIRHASVDYSTRSLKTPETNNDEA